MTPAERVAIREAIAKLEQALAEDVEADTERPPRCAMPDCQRCAKYGPLHDTGYRP